MTAGFLTTRVGRRFLAVNLLTALLPMVVITALSFTYVRAELRDQVEGRVNRLAKSVGMATLSYLTSISLTLIGPRDSSALATNFVTTGRADLTQHATLPHGLFPTLLPTQRAQLEADRPLLLLADAGRETALVLARATFPWTASSRPVTWGRLRNDRFASEIDEIVEGERVAVCLFETTSLRRIHCSAGVLPGAEARARARVRTGGSGHESTAEGDIFVSARDVYLRHEYGTPEWTAVVIQPAVATFAGAAEFRNSFLLLGVAVIVLIFAMSHAQIRRTTEPLARLEEATRRLGDGDFDVPIIITGDDEFTRVAASFNGMASSLQRQIALMRSLDGIDQSALGARDTTAVVAEALTTISGLIPSGRVCIAIAHPTDSTAMTVRTCHRGAGARPDFTLHLPAHERDELLRNARHVLLTGADGARSYRRSGDDHGAIALPLVKDRDLLGVICVELVAGAHAGDAWCSEARRIADRVALALSNVQLLSRLDALSAGTVLAFARAIDANSPWTAGHSERVTQIALEIGRDLQLSETELDTLQRGGLLHDIGKIAVPPAVLDKASYLTNDEWALMRRHPVVGCEILSPIPAFADALPIVRSHHERMDGSGYPDQLRGEDIPYLARVLAVADVFDALASDRPYRAAMTSEVACSIIQRGSGTHFSPKVVHALVNVVHGGRVSASTSAHASARLAAAVAHARAPAPQPA